MAPNIGPRESRALLVFFGGVLVLFAFFAVGAYVGRLARPAARPAPQPPAPVEPARGPTEYFLVEVALLDNQADAEALVAKLRQQYISAWTAPDPANPGLYGVYLGLYPHREQAETIRAELAEQGLQPKIVRQRESKAPAPAGQ
jgi:cell division septation protein DedD